MAELQNSVTAMLAHAARDGAVRELMAVGEGRPGALRLSAEQAREVAHARSEALQAEGLVEVPTPALLGAGGADGAGGAAGLARGFADSPYVDERTYAQVLCDLQPVFCALRRQCGPEVSDAELIDALRAAFDTDEVAGCVELLADRSLAELAELAELAAAPADAAGIASARDEAAWFGVPDERAARRIEEDELPRPWNEDEWVDRFDADGWDGERWCESHGFDCDDLR